MKTNLFTAALFCLTHLALHATELLTGPMVGYTTFNEVTCWVQTTAPTQVTIKYWPEGETNSVQETTGYTESKDGCVIKLIATELKENTEYNYAVYVDGKQATPTFREDYAKASGEIPLRFQTRPKWRHRGDGKAAPDFTVALGSCAYINQEGHLWEDTKKPEYGGDYQIFESIYEKSPDVMLWLGDNIYLSETDWQSVSGIHKRYVYTRSTPHLKPLLANTVNYAIWDDHDYGPNNMGREFWNKKATRDAFKLFWANPPYPSEAIYSFFNWGDVNFFLLDDRWFKTQSDMVTGEKAFLGEQQLNWLIESLKGYHSQSSFVYRNTFNIIACGSQVLSDSTYPENLRQYKAEWTELMTRIAEEEISNVIFLSGDIHTSEISRETFTNSKGKEFTFYDITCSPLTSGIHYRDTDNSKRIGEQIKQRNFATLDFAGPLDARTMTIKYYDSDGALINQAANAEPGTVDDMWVISAQK